MRSRAICMGYLHQPDKTAAEFCHGYWKSGDFGRIDADGFLYVLDRVKDTISHKGSNVYPTEVESALCDHPQIQLAAVVGVDDPECGESVHAEVVLRDGATVDVATIKAYLVGRVTGNIPRSINFSQTLPSARLARCCAG